MRILADDVYAGLLKVAEDHGIKQPDYDYTPAIRQRECACPPAERDGWEDYDPPVTIEAAMLCSDAVISLLVLHALHAASGY